MSTQLVTLQNDDVKIRRKRKTDVEKSSDPKISKYSYLGIYLQQLMPYINYIGREDSKRALNEFRDQKFITYKDSKVLIDYQKLTIEETPQASVVMALYPHNSRWLQTRHLLYKPNVSISKDKTPLERYLETLTVNWVRIIQEHDIKGSVYWVTFYGPSATQSVWEVPHFDHILEKTVKYFKQFPDVNLDKFYLLGDESGGEAILTSLGPKFLHHFASIAVTNCSKVPNDLCKYFVNYPMVIHVKGNVSLEPQRAEFEKLKRQIKTDFDKEIKDILELIDTKNTNHGQILKYAITFLSGVVRDPTPEVLNWYQHEGKKNRHHFWLSLTNVKVRKPIAIFACRYSNKKIGILSKDVDEVYVDIHQSTIVAAGDPVIFRFNESEIVASLTVDPFVSRVYIEKFMDPRMNPCEVILVTK